jgi:putative glutathione S-transferase
MGFLIDGVWRDEELPQEVGRAGEFRRADSRFRDRITADGSSGFEAEALGGITSMLRTAARGRTAR